MKSDCCCFSSSSEGRPHVADWQPIKLIDGPVSKGIDPEFAGQNVFEWELAQVPEWEWADAFNELVRMNSFRVSLEGKTITLKPAPNELQAYANSIRSWIRQTNTRYESTILPRLEQQRTLARERGSKTAERERAAREEAETLDLADDDLIT